MKRVFLSLLAAALLFAATTAQAVTLWVGVTDPSSGNDWLLGVPADLGSGAAVNQVIGQLGTGFGDMVPNTVPSPGQPATALVYTIARALNPGDSGSWTATDASFDLLVSSIGGAAGQEEKRYTVHGLLGDGGNGLSTGSVTPTSSGLTWTLNKITDITGAPFDVYNLGDPTVADPISGARSAQWSFELPGLSGVPVTMWMIATMRPFNPTTNPGDPANPPTSVEGSITVVPEPGALAFLFGFGCIGALAVIRRRK